VVTFEPLFCTPTLQHGRMNKRLSSFESSAPAMHIGSVFLNQTTGWMVTLLPVYPVVRTFGRRWIKQLFRVSRNNKQLNTMIRIPRVLHIYTSVNKFPTSAKPESSSSHSKQLVMRADHLQFLLSLLLQPP
jgi:hypothetical protein